MNIKFDNVNEVIKAIENSCDFLEDSDIENNALNEVRETLQNCSNALLSHYYDFESIVSEVDLTHQFYTYYIKHRYSKCDDSIHFYNMYCMSNLKSDIFVYKVTCRQRYYVDTKLVRDCTMFVYSTFDMSKSDDNKTVFDFESYIDELLECQNFKNENLRIEQLF